MRTQDGSWAANSPNDKHKILEALAPHQEAIQGVVVESTYTHTHKVSGLDIIHNVVYAGLAMPRPRRIEFESAWYHVLNRGARRWNIYHDDDDRSFFLGLLGEIRETWNVEIHAYSLMDNHYHLLVHTPNASLSLAMKHVGSLYTLYYNKKYRKDGPLFRGRFKSILAEKDEYFLELLRYIHMNPVKAKLCNQPEQHAWTSHCAYLDKKKRVDCLVVEEVLAEFARTERVAIKRLDNFVKSAEDPNLVLVLSAKRRVNVLGSKGFRDWVKYNFIEKMSRDVALPTARSNRRVKQSTTKLLRFVMSEYGVSKKDIITSVKTRNNEPRLVLMYLLRQVNGSTHADIAKYLGIRTISVSKALQRMRADEDSPLLKRAQAYRDNLMYYVQA